jgi:hypothetical protein
MKANALVMHSQEGATFSLHTHQDGRLTMQSVQPLGNALTINFTPDCVEAIRDYLNDWLNKP